MPRFSSGKVRYAKTEEKAGEENERAKGRGKDEVTYPPLYLFLSSEESREEETVKDKSNLGKYEQAWVRVRDTREYRREKDR